MAAHSIHMLILLSRCHSAEEACTVISAEPLSCVPAEDTSDTEDTGVELSSGVGTFHPRSFANMVSAKISPQMARSITIMIIFSATI